MHWHARIPAHRRIPRYLRASMLIDGERDDEAVMRAEDEAIAAAAKPHTPQADYAALMEVLAERPVEPGREVTTPDADQDR